jgi:hypothetical protein
MHIIYDISSNPIPPRGLKHPPRLPHEATRFYTCDHSLDIYGLEALNRAIRQKPPFRKGLQYLNCLL